MSRHGLHVTPLEVVRVTPEAPPRGECHGIKCRGNGMVCVVFLCKPAKRNSDAISEVLSVAPDGSSG